jgi:hypothetical protein
MQRQATHWTIALQRALAVSIVVSVVLLAFTWLAQRSAQSDFKLAVEELRARAGELALLSQIRDSDALPAIAARATASQLRKRIADVHDDIVAVDKKTPLPGTARAAQIADTLATNADRLAADHAPSAPNGSPARDIAELTRALIEVETEARPK